MSFNMSSGACFILPVLVSGSASEALADREGFRVACAAPAFAPSSEEPGAPPSDAAFRRQVDFLPRRAGSRIAFLCFETLREDFDRVVKPFCDRKCELPTTRVNSARRRPEHFDAGTREAVRDYVADVYAADVALYAQHCGGAPERDFWTPRAPPPRSAPVAAAGRYRKTKRRRGGGFAFFVRSMLSLF